MGYHPDNLITQNAKPSDSAAIRQLAIDANIDAWSENGYSDEISRPNSFVLKATENGDLVGFLVARIVPGTTECLDADLYNIAVLPSRKRAGIGSKLLAALLERAADSGVCSIWIEVRESNSEAITFYRSHGFRSELTRPNFYTNPVENAVIMQLRMSGERDIPEPQTMLDSQVEQE